MRIAIVGAAGQVGSAIMRRLSKREDLTIFGVTRNEFSALPLRHQGFEMRVGSVTENESCRRLLDSSNMVINAALHIGLPKASRTINQSIIRNLIQESGAEIVVHLSSVAVYGSCLDGSYSTFENPRGDSTYAREKLGIEWYAASIAEQTGARLAVLRLGHVYGPGQGYSKQIFADLQSPEWSLPFNGELPSNTVHVERLADAIPSLYKTSDRTSLMNAVNGPQKTWREIYDLHSRAAGLPPAAAMPLAKSSWQREAHKKVSRRSTLGRTNCDIIQWFRSLPLSVLTDARGVREAMDTVMLKAPEGFERKVYQKYQKFAAGQRIRSTLATTVPPMYFCDAAPGPNLLSRMPGSGADFETEEERLAQWYASFAAPLWKAQINHPLK